MEIVDIERLAPGRVCTVMPRVYEASGAQSARPVLKESRILFRTSLVLGTLLICGLSTSLLAMISPLIQGAPAPIIEVFNVVIGALVLLSVLVASSTQWRLPSCSPELLPWLAGVACLIIGISAGTFWPNSGDEYSYTFLADTLLRGRLTNPRPPDPELFRSLRVFVVGDHMVSQYPPGWPLVLAPFRRLGLDALANPLLTVLLGRSLLGTMRYLQVEQSTQSASLMLVLWSPFVLFNGSSLFSHTLTATIAGLIVWQQLLDEHEHSWWRRMLIGALFGMMLLVRYEAFFIFMLLYIGDSVWRRRILVLADALPIMTGAAPFVMFCLVYDHAITGHFMQTPAALTNPDMTLQQSVVGISAMATRGGGHLLYWMAGLSQFGGLILAALQLFAIVGKAKAQSLRFFDLALPATIVFFLYFPHDGGHQYGPRYWFWAWPLASLTVCDGLSQRKGIFRLDPISYQRIVCASLLSYAMVLPTLVFTTRAYIDARRIVFQPPRTALAGQTTAAIVLLPSRWIQPLPRLVPQLRMLENSGDLVRNDVDSRNRILYGRLDAPDALPRACSMHGRSVLIWQAPRILTQVRCGG